MTSSSPPTERRKAKKARPRKPGRLLEAIARLHDERPEHVPLKAVLLAAWLELPGDNTQRTQHWAVKQRWHEVVQDHFAACMAVQPHPGLLENPHVHVELRVRGVGDEANSYGRAKYLIDRLQRRRTVVAMVGGQRQERVYGMLDLIEDDKVLRIGRNLSIQERYARATAEKNDCVALIWIWNEEGFEW